MPQFLRPLTLLSLLAFTLFYAITSLHWPLVEDPPIMHYVVFLIDHGLHPYAQISDNNLPGAYLTESWAMHLFGPTDLAWRLYDLTLLALLTLATLVVTRPYGPLPGLLAAAMFVFVHAADGPRYTGQREELIAVLLLLAFAALFEAVRRNQPWLALPFGVLTALAASIKPTFAPLPIAVLALLALRRQNRPIAPILLYAAAGMAAIAALILAFLVHHQALQAFIQLLTIVTPAYRALHPASPLGLAVRAYPLLLLPIPALAIALKLWTPPTSQPHHQLWEQLSLLLAALTGLASYLLQGKGFYHHRYTFIAFTFLLSSIQLTQSLKTPGWPRRLATAAILYLTLVCTPLYARLTTRYARGLEPTAALQHTLEQSLEQDLTTLAAGDPTRLQHQILCFDLVSGCLSALYHLQLVESSGFTGDLLFFRQPLTPPVAFAHDLFWRSIAQSPPTILVITTEWFGEHDTFAKIDTWPAFVQYLQANFTPVVERRFPTTVSQDPADAHPARIYRIYRRNRP